MLSGSGSSRGVNERHFLSDNAAGAHPAVLRALERVNAGHAPAYGNDPVTAETEALLARHFGAISGGAFVVLTGTAANVLALQSLVRSFEAVIATEASHLHRDECGAPEKFLGGKVLLARSRFGKLAPEDVRPILADHTLVHRVQPKVLSISQCTEWGTVYSPDEVRALSALCREEGLMLHVDGARLSNAAVHLGLTLEEATRDLGVDVVSFGGTKNGLLGAEAVVFLSPTGAGAFPFFRKQGMQLISKMRFVSAQLIAMLESDLWRKNAGHANAMASRLAEEVRTIDGVELVAPVEANMVFARLPQPWIAPLQEHRAFNVWERHTERSIVRWVTSFDTEENDVRSLADRLRAITKQCPIDS